MTPSQVRAELLGEHFELRRLSDEARAVLRSDPTPDALRGSVERLADALLAHSRHEEDALRVILGAVDEQRARNAVMDEQHISEHARLVAVLRAAGASPDAGARLVRVGEVLDELESHMTTEEEVLLAEELFADLVEPK
jgi:hypothetical protein